MSVTTVVYLAMFVHIEFSSPGKFKFRFGKYVLPNAKVSSFTLKLDARFILQMHRRTSDNLFPKTVEVCQTLLLLNSNILS